MTKSIGSALVHVGSTVCRIFVVVFHVAKEDAFSETGYGLSMFKMRLEKEARVARTSDSRGLVIVLVDFNGRNKFLERVCRSQSFG